jgi:hypothetical protein
MKTIEALVTYGTAMSHFVPMTSGIAMFFFTFTQDTLAHPVSEPPSQ